VSTERIDRIAAAVEADAGQSIPGLRESLAQVDADERGRSYTPEQIALHQARQSLRLTQEGLARLLRTPVGTVRDWEQGRSSLPGSALLIAQMAIEQPEVLKPYIAEAAS
jgi:putative transcriptional regulator